MFNRFYKAKGRKASKGNPTTPTYVVYDRRTNLPIASGTLTTCRAFVNGFGSCYIKEA